MPGEGYDTMSTGLGNPYGDLGALRNAEFDAGLQSRNHDYNISRIRVDVLVSTDDPTEEFIPIEDPTLKENRELRTWLDRLPIIVAVYPLPFLPLDQHFVNSFDPTHQDQVQKWWIYWFRKHIEESPVTKWSVYDRIMDDFNNAQAANAQLNGANDPDDAELFGSDSGSEKSHDEDVESGDENRAESAKDDSNDNKEPVHTREENVIDVSIGNHAIPKPSDGEVSSLSHLTKSLTVPNAHHSFTSYNSLAILVLSRGHLPQVTGSLLLPSITPPRPHRPLSQLTIPQTIPPVGGTHRMMHSKFNPTPVFCAGRMDP